MLCEMTLLRLVTRKTPLLCDRLTPSPTAANTWRNSFSQAPVDFCNDLYICAKDATSVYAKKRSVTRSALLYYPEASTSSTAKDISRSSQSCVHENNPFLDTRRRLKRMTIQSLISGALATLSLIRSSQQAPAQGSTVHGDALIRSLNLLPATPSNVTALGTLYECTPRHPIALAD